jgi:hypothetical protein
MLFDRQKRLLALLDALGGDVGGLDFQKLLFLYCREVETTPTYEFVPYRYGGFSFTSYADKRRLMERGLLADEERAWKLTPAGRTRAKVDGRVRLGMDRFAQSHAHLRGDALVAEAYRRHPFYAIRSEMAVRLLAGDKLALMAIEAARPAATRPGLCTIGYEGSTLENYLNRLLCDGVTVLCDVRRNPLSRKYGFSKGTLSKARRARAWASATSICRSWASPRRSGASCTHRRITTRCLRSMSARACRSRRRRWRRFAAGSKTATAWR